MTTINYLYQQYINLSEADRKDFISTISDPLILATFNASYTEPRGQEYPSVAHQLDALWHDLDSGAIPGKDTSLFYNNVKQVKDKYPKPN